ncbi:MAG: hypothetical protein QOJ47_1002, partial [Gaiellales bacterium]|nr:hypothetical protein [Gaiellales bacterium]
RTLRAKGELTDRSLPARPGGEALVEPVDT